MADTARLVRDVHQSLTLLGKKSSDADKAVAMLSQCQEQILTLDDAKPLVNYNFLNYRTRAMADRGFNYFFIFFLSG